jgi:ribosomal protein S18 acetylase RimI-like enzyme
MNAILQDLSTPKIVAAIEDNLFALIHALRKWPRAEVHDEVDIKWSMTDIPFPLFNSILRAQLAPEKIDVTIQSIISEAKSQNVPLLWWTGPATQPSDLGSHLERHGFVREGQMPGMAVDLANLNENLPMPGGLTIEQVRDDETRKQWIHVFAAGFEVPDFAADAFYDFMSYDDPEISLAYIGWLNGQPVATLQLALVAGVAGIYNVATLPAGRRKGIGAIMTLSPLQEARKRGYQVGILQASDMGVGLYRSLGFREYCQIGQYIWSSDHT